MGAEPIKTFVAVCLTALVSAIFSSNTFAWELNWSRDTDDAQAAHALVREAFSRVRSDSSAQQSQQQKDFNIKTDESSPLVEIQQGEPSMVDAYIEILVLNAQTFQVVGDNGRMHVRMTFGKDGLRFPIGERDSRDVGQVYAVDLGREVSLDAYYSQGALYASHLQGLNVQVKLVLVPDTLSLKQFIFNFDNQIAELYASAVYDLVHLVARASVRLRRFEGIDWFLPVFESIPPFVDKAIFWPAL